MNLIVSTKLDNSLISITFFVALTIKFCVSISTTNQIAGLLIHSVIYDKLLIPNVKKSMISVNLEFSLPTSVKAYILP